MTTFLSFSLQTLPVFHQENPGQVGREGKFAEVWKLAFQTSPSLWIFPRMKQKSAWLRPRTEKRMALLLPRKLFNTHKLQYAEPEPAFLPKGNNATVISGIIQLAWYAYYITGRKKNKWETRNSWKLLKVRLSFLFRVRNMPLSIITCRTLFVD